MVRKDCFTIAKRNEPSDQNGVRYRKSLQSELIYMYIWHISCDYILECIVWHQMTKTSAAARANVCCTVSIRDHAV
jgi:hypothetical protein